MSAFRSAKITTTVVERLRPGETVMDTGLSGFGVRRQGDAAVYFVRKYANGRRHYQTVGEHGLEGWTAHRAREAALEIIAALKQGKDPAVERARLRGMPTLAAYGAAFIENQAGKLKPGTLDNYRSMLRTHIAPQDARGILSSGCLGRLRLDQVRHQDIAHLHRQLRGTPRAANHVLAFISRLYSAAHVDRLVERDFNPTVDVERYPEKSRQRFLSQEEMKRVGEALSAAECEGTEDPYAIAAIRLLILTGCRRNEILAARWDWIDLDRKVLNLPDSKTGAKPVLLSPAAIEVLRTLPRVTGNPHLIVGAREGKRWVNLRKVWVRVRQQAGLAPTVLADGSRQEVRLHDLRHSYASLLAARGASLPMIGKLLGHTNPQTTARYAHLAEDPIRHLADEVGQVASAVLNGRVSGDRDDS